MVWYINSIRLKPLSIAVLATVLAFSNAAIATTISINEYTSGAYGSAVAGLSNFASEDFEMAGPEREIAFGTALPTDVGTFETVGGTGSGGTVKGLSGNTGRNVAIRDGNVFGRVNTTSGGSFFLDSNDTHGISWDVSTGSMFDTIVFTLTDASEFSFLRVTADGISAEQRVGRRLSDGNTSLVEIILGTAMSSLTVELTNFSASGGTRLTNDGFSIDDTAVGLAAVPLPASLPLLVAGAGLFAVIRRKQRKAA